MKEHPPPERPIQDSSALGGKVSQKIIDIRKPKPKKSDENFRSTLGSDIDYTNMTVPKAISPSKARTFPSVLNGRPQTTTKLASAVVKHAGHHARYQKQSISVSFSSDTKPPKPFNPSKIGYTDPPRRGTTKFGKANMARDIPIVVFAFAILFFTAIQLGNVGETSDITLARRAKYEKMQNAKEERRRERTERYENRPIDCNLFLADSSIPGAGLSLFAGRYYNASDTVLTSSIAFTFSEASKELLDYGLILKHHPLLANLNGGIWRQGEDETVELTASQEILPGHELFLAFDDHPASLSRSKLFSKIPLPEHYELADEIVKEEIKVQHKRTQRNMHQQGGEGTVALRLVQNVVAKIVPGVAQLLPAHKSRLESLRTAGVPPVAYAMLNNKTLGWLELNGHCLDLVKRMENGSLVAKVAIKKGKIISTMPLFATGRSSSYSTDDQLCSARPSCYGHAKSHVRLCPLSPVAHISQTNDTSKANAEYQWSKWNSATSECLGWNASHLLSENAKLLSFDIFATKGIKAGEELVLYIGEAPVSDFVQVHTGMFSEHWLESIKVEQRTAEDPEKVETAPER